VSEDHTRHMRQALTLGRRGLGRVAPWPSVGCVLVREGRIVGRGTSDAVTLRHAERVALDQAGEAARGATAYVTLEPCSHHGRTPPCADALVAAGIARVVIAAGDPNPQVAGQGIARLRAAGIEVLTGVLEKEATEQHLGFFRVMTEGRPMLTLKLASTLDGRIATASGESRWITGPQARRAVHALRMSHDAVLVGVQVLDDCDGVVGVELLDDIGDLLRLDAEIFSEDGSDHAAGHVLIQGPDDAGALATRLLGDAPDTVRRLFAA